MALAVVCSLVALHNDHGAACEGRAAPASVPALRAARDLELLRRLPRTGCGLRYASCVDRFVSAPKTLAQKGAYQHVPKTAGSAVEAFLGLPFSGHWSMRLKHPYLSGLPFFTVLRHPIERIVSWYSFLQTGEAQNITSSAAALLGTTPARPSTRRAPRLTPFEFASSGEHSVYEHGYLMSNHADDNAWDKHQGGSHRHRRQLHD